LIGFEGVCDFCIAATEEEAPSPDLRIVAATAKEIGRKISPHRCRSPETCQCGCNWMDAETARLGNYGGWIPALKCVLCGSERVIVNVEAEEGRCKECGGCWGGANFWRLLPPSPGGFVAQPHQVTESISKDGEMALKLKSLQFKPAKFDKDAKIYAVPPSESSDEIKEFLRQNGGKYEDTQYLYRISETGWINRFPKKEKKEG
jgi:hypothetical protein